MERAPKAIDCYNKALKLTPRSELIIKNLASNYFTVKNYLGCVQMLDRVNINGDKYLTGIYNQSRAMIAKK